MTIDFKAATDILLTKIRPEELANEIGCSLQMIRQARMGEGTGGGRRLPPSGWEKAVRKLAERQAARLQELSNRIGREGNPSKTGTSKKRDY